MKHLLGERALGGMEFSSRELLPLTYCSAFNEGKIDNPRQRETGKCLRPLLGWSRLSQAPQPGQDEEMELLFMKLLASCHLQMDLFVGFFFSCLSHCSP